MSLARLPRQRGAALLTAMLIVTLVATLAAGMVWRQYRAVQIEAADRARTQSGWILQGALDWARLILREDARANRSDAVDHLGEVWAVPLAEARLSTFLAAEGSSGEDGPEAFLSGSMEDAQARYNLRLLATTTDAKVQAQELRALNRICESAGVPGGTAIRLASKLRAAFAAEPDANTAPIKPQNVEQLRWLGLSSETVALLRPYLTLLPTATPVNLNTASREVLAAVFENMDLASAQRLVQYRQSSPFRSVTDAQNLLSSNITLDTTRAAVISSYFWVRGRLRLEYRVLEERSLVYRNDLDIQAKSRQRVNLALDNGP